MPPKANKANNGGGNGKKKRRPERHLTAAQQKQMNRQRNLRRGTLRSTPPKTVDGTPLNVDEHFRLTCKLHQLRQDGHALTESLAANRRAKEREADDAKAADADEAEKGDDSIDSIDSSSEVSVKMEGEHRKEKGGGVVLVKRRRHGDVVSLNVLPVDEQEVEAMASGPIGDEKAAVDEILKNQEMVELLRAIGSQRDMDTAELESKIQTLGLSQQTAYRRAVEYHESLFLTGGAGKGKTYLLSCIISGLRQTGRSVAVLAPTGVAAHHIHGMTIHSFLKLAPVWYNRKVDQILEHYSRKPEKLQRLQLLDTIVIDEISMVPADVLTLLDRVLQLANENTKPFGSIQIIVCGDFFQLPPVAKGPPGSNQEDRPKRQRDDAGDPSKQLVRMLVNRTIEAAKARERAMAKSVAKGYPVTWQRHVAKAQQEAINTAASAEQAEKMARPRPPFCFETKVWREVFVPERCVELKESFRQKDPLFIALLNNARVGALSQDDVATLKLRHKNTISRMVAESRQRRWQRAAAAINCRDMAEFRVRLFSTCAQVDAHNFKMRQSLQRLNNPTHTYHTQYVLRPWTDKQIARREEQQLWFAEKRKTLPKNTQLFYAEYLAEYDVTQEEALDKLDEEVSVDDKIELCVGCRVMLMKNWQTAKGLVHGRTGWVVGFGVDGPLVLFDEKDHDWSLPDAAERYMSQAIEVPPIEWSTICETGRLVATQVPLGFAWAMTIHKSQGLSMARADIDLAFLFEAGQGYVALSRLTTLLELGLLDLKPEGIFADPRVLTFYAHSFPDNASVLPPGGWHHSAPAEPPLPIFASWPDEDEKRPPVSPKDGTTTTSPSNHLQISKPTEGVAGGKPNGTSSPRLPSTVHSASPTGKLQEHSGTAKSTVNSASSNGQLQEHSATPNADPSVSSDANEKAKQLQSESSACSAGEVEQWLPAAQEPFELARAQHTPLADTGAASGSEPSHTPSALVPLEENRQTTGASKGVEPQGDTQNEGRPVRQFSESELTVYDASGQVIAKADDPMAGVGVGVFVDETVDGATDEPDANESDDEAGVPPPEATSTNPIMGSQAYIPTHEAFSTPEERLRSETLLLDRYGADFVAFLQIQAANSRFKSNYLSSIPILIDPFDKRHLKTQPQTPSSQPPSNQPQSAPQSAPPQPQSATQSAPPQPQSAQPSMAQPASTGPASTQVPPESQNRLPMRPPLQRYRPHAVSAATAPTAAMAKPPPRNPSQSHKPASQPSPAGRPSSALGMAPRGGFAAKRFLTPSSPAKVGTPNTPTPNQKSSTPAPTPFIAPQAAPAAKAPVAPATAAASSLKRKKAENPTETQPPAKRPRAI